MRVLHALVFGGAVLAALTASSEEWRWLLHSVRQPFSPGLPPLLPVLGTSGAALLIGLALAFTILRRRSAPLVLSLAVLGTVATTFVLLNTRAVAPPRTWGSADVVILRTLTALHTTAREALQQEGEVPAAEGDWATLLARSNPPVLPIHPGVWGRFMSAKVLLVASPIEAPPVLIPGTLLVSVSHDQASFTVRAVGLSAGGEPALLRDANGEPLTLTATFDPQLKSSRGL